VGTGLCYSMGHGPSDMGGCKKCSHGARAKPKARPPPRAGPRPKAGAKKKGGKKEEALWPLSVEVSVGYMSVEVSVEYMSVGWACGRARGRGALGERPSGEGVEWGGDGSPSLERSALTMEHLSLDRLGGRSP
jgi:hypothetical protein